MRKRILTLLVMLAVMPIMAFGYTSQSGYTKTLGRPDRHGKPLPGVTVRITGSHNSLLSDKGGRFAVPMPQSSSQKSFSVTSVSKTGYKICDNDQLNRAYYYSDKNVLELALITQKEALELTSKSESKLRESNEKQYQTRYKKLQAELNAHKLTEEKYRAQLQELQSNFDKYEKLIPQLAERYALTDYDRLDSLDKVINFSIEQGEFARADSLINTKGDIWKRAAKAKEFIQQNNKLADELARNRSLEAKEVESIANDLYNKYTIALKSYDNNSAKRYITERSDLDSTNVEWLLETGRFLDNYCALYDLSKKYYESALTEAKKQFGEEHPYVATSLNNIGLVYDSQGKYTEALKYYEQALNIWKKIFGEEHPDVATSLNNIGSVYCSQGEYTEALDYYKQSLNILGKVYGEEHPDVATSLNNIGYVYCSQGKYAEALAYYEQALKIQKKVYGEEHPNVATSLNNIGGVYDSQGKYAEAMDYYEQALNIRKKVYGEEHPDVATSLNNIGSVYCSHGEYTEALDYYKQSLNILEKVYGEEHPNVAGSLNNIGYVYGSQGKYTEALDYYKQALNIKKKVYGEEHPDVAGSLHNIGYVYDRQGKYAEALKYYEQALNIRKKVLGTEHIDVALSLNNIGTVYYEQGKYTEALEYYEHALNIRKKVYGEEHPDVAISLNNIGLVYSSQGKYTEALEYYEQALSIRKKIFENENTDLIESLYNVYGCYTHLIGQKETSEQYRSKMKDFMKNILFTAVVTSEDCPAYKQGLSGEYYLLAFQDWDMESEESLSDNIAKMQEKSKTITLLRDNKVSQHYFENRIGMLFVPKWVSKEEKQRVLSLWKKNKQ